MLYTSATRLERLRLENPQLAAQFRTLSERLQQSGQPVPEDIRAWCHLGLEQGHAALVQGVCQRLLEEETIHPALRPYWLFFLGGALLQQFQVEAGVSALRQALEALCDAPLVYNRLPRSSKFEDPRIEQQLWQVLAELAAGGVRAFAHAGTLLGLVRENRLLPFDKDLDLALTVDELASAHEIMLAHGWQCPAQPFVIDNMASYRHPETAVVLDLCALTPEEGGASWLGGFWINHGSPANCQRQTRFPQPQLEMKAGPAGPVWQLRDPQRWLEAMYGPAWRIPDPFFDTIIGAHNLLGFSLLTQWYAYSRMTNACLNGYWEKALRLIRLVQQRHTPDDALLHRLALTLESKLAQISVNA